MSTTLMERVEDSRKRGRPTMSLMERVEDSRQRGRLTMSLMERVEDSRKRGRLTMSLMERVESITGLPRGEVVHGGRDRDSWRSDVVASVGGTTIQQGLTSRTAPRLLLIRPNLRQLIPRSQGLGLLKTPEFLTPERTGNSRKDELRLETTTGCADPRFRVISLRSSGFVVRKFACLSYSKKVYPV
ncbi:hypothetical protein ElyMa_000806800 [Elysia marginata]|uniref:Uncharacterized protein n=1 Tax=Elysia marginata TaxID=1093978 RepID=A0AAV4GWB8_9GAST|nr:hypothetical protein ElyMa_000806800 [Elysia marginata]